ncbi:MAG: phytoene synthase [Gammaproteobacteria bacterium]|nr:phytoene synthase [Gammaproteobacteria bacterium]
MSKRSKPRPSNSDYTYQNHILQGVSRTFALTIPQLPDALSDVVSNAYLLCRIADTIEDDKDLAFPDKKHYSSRFIDVVKGSDEAKDFAAKLVPLLSASTSEDEKDLIKNTAAVIRISHSFNQRQRQALERCIRLMSDGMSQYQESNVKNGLKDQGDMDRYCYFVAGVVGEMLTELFCDYSSEINSRHDELMSLAVSFGQGLQMTNILKDIWEDQEREMCWLPAELFEKHGIALSRLREARNSPEFEDALQELIGLAHSHLSNALHYTLLLPKNEIGMRRFCLWALGMAVLTLRKINRNPDFIAGKQVKISRRSVKATIFFSNLFTRQNGILRFLFRVSSSGLPTEKLSDNFPSNTI